VKVFLDANVIVSVLNKEYPLFTYASRVLSLADNQKFEIYTSPICLAIAFYFAEKKSGTALAKKKISVLAESINISAVDKHTVQRAAGNIKVNDFEDGLEFYAAIESGCTCIVTEDIGDFYFSNIEVLDSKAFLNKYVIAI